MNPENYTMIGMLVTMAALPIILSLIITYVLFGRKIIAIINIVFRFITAPVVIPVLMLIELPSILKGWYIGKTRTYEEIKKNII